MDFMQCELIECETISIHHYAACRQIYTHHDTPNMCEPNFCHNSYWYDKDMLVQARMLYFYQ